MRASPILIGLLVASAWILAAPTAVAACTTTPCVDAEWHGCGNGNTPPVVRCEAVCYTVHWDPPPPPDNFYVSATWCMPLLGDTTETLR